MKILVVGGGSGGHVTPTMAVVREILAVKPRAVIEFWTDRKYYKNVVKITTETEVKWREDAEDGGKGAGVLTVKKIHSGKFRRYAGWKLWDYFENIEITLKDLIIGNFLGFLGFLAGILQSFWRLWGRKTRPDVIFLKGGFVGLPVGLVARFLKIPYIIHESDTVMGLANRTLAKGAAKVALGQERGVEGQAGDVEDWEVVGVPVAEEFKKITKTKQRELKRAFGFDVEQPLVVITGGSLGSMHMNQATAEILSELLKFTSVGLVAGRKNYEEMMWLKKYEVWEKAKLKSNFRLWKFNGAMYELLGAADVVVSRAGATTIMELANLAGPAVILVPFEKLPGGHQVVNAKKLVKEGAVEMIVDENMVKNPNKLLVMIEGLVRDEEKRKELKNNLSKIAKPEAAKRLAEIVLAVAEERRK